ncbi:armadillo-type protein [Gymnopilus junonius]|uniref:Armadillo-type protein n=1 Tax=Gymnopilus junonius TaxID=109634 RepID=A0A9P5NMK1_GYMJU|nr:armadillo-type protein [Gymnopilus junonius]
MPPKTRQPRRKRLAFHDKLVPTKGAALSTDALLTKLSSLHTQLAALDQESVDTASLAIPRAELIHTSLLLHKDRGVKAYTACCLADILRLYAPEAPYTQPELRDIFQFFFRQLSAGFKGQDEPYFNEYFHLLESLSTVKSVVLVCDLPSADELLYDIFKDVFTIVKRDFTKKVEIFMADILVALIDECTSLPSDALEVIMAQFVDKNLGPENPAYRLAVQVCNAAADKLQRNVCQYFGDLLTAHHASTSHTRSSSPDDKDSTNEEESLRTSHALIKRLHSACPAVLHSVIPILETELRADGLGPRLMATQTLGEMYADKSGVDLVRKYPLTWSTWVSRKQDISVAVRLKCVEAVPPLLVNLPEQRETLDELLMAKMYDPDERVRTAVCKVYSHLDYEAALHHVSLQTLRAVVGRGLDKKASVRTQALNSIGRLYSLAYPEIENKDKAAITQFGWIPDEMLLDVAAGAPTRALVEQVLYDYILPLPSMSTSSSSSSKDKEKERDKDKDVDEVAWTDRLLGTMRTLGDKSRTMLITLSGIKSTRPNPFDFWLDACIKNNGGVIDEDEEAVVRKLKATTQHLAAMFPDPVKASEDLQAFAKLNENRLYKLLKICMSPQTDVKTLVKSSNEFLKRTEHLQPSILPTMRAILRRSSYGIVNQSSIPTLLKRVLQVQKGKDKEAPSSGKTTGTSAKDKAHQAALLLGVVAKHSPGLLKPHVGELCRLLADAEAGLGGDGMDVDFEDETQTQTQTQTQAQTQGRGKGKGKGKEKAKEAEESKDKDKDKDVPSIVEVALMCLANVVRWDEKLASSIDKKTNERIVRLALGSEWRQAKFAARYLAFCKSKGTLCAEVIESISSAFEKDAKRVKQKENAEDEDMEDDEEEDEQSRAERTAAHMTALTQLARFAPEAFELQSEVIMTYLVKRVLMIRHPPPEDEDDEEEWIENEDIPAPLRAKLQALKVCRNRCLTHASSEQALEIVTPALKLFATLVDHEGSLNPDVEDEDPKYKSRMRLQAAISLLHLSTVEIYASAMSPKFVRLACVMQDSCFNVRLAFITRLISFLLPRKIPPRYNVIPFLSVLDPEPDTRIMASAYIANAKAKMPDAMRVDHLETIFIRLLHLLAHHPDFGTTQDELVDLATYVQFYLDLMATSENISLLYHLAHRGKTVRDPESHSSSENFYVMCELAQYLIKARAQAHSWTLQTYPTKIKLPSDILRPLPSAEAVNELLKTSYLPEEAPQWLADKFKIGSTIKEKKEKKERVPAKRKAPAAAAKANGHSRRKKKRPTSDDDDEEEDQGTSEADEQGTDAEMEDGTGAAPSKSRAGKPRKSDVSEENRAPKMTRAERLSARTQAKERLSTGSKKAAEQSDDDG